MIKKISKKVLLANIFVFFLLFLIPAFSGAQGGIVYECNHPNKPVGECDFNDLILAVKKVVNWLIVFTLEFSVVIIAYAGFNYMVSGDNPGKRTEANKMLTKVVIGIFFVLAAWLIVTLIANVLLDPAFRSAVPI